jgi:ABC-type transport system involved in multi-copper enzyme maturation permease subunit
MGDHQQTTERRAPQGQPLPFDASSSILHPPSSALRAWFYLIGLSWQRQARARQMVWIALGLLVFASGFVAVQTAAGRWNLGSRRWNTIGPNRDGPTYKQWADDVQALLLAVPHPAAMPALDQASLAATQAVLDRSAFVVFTKGMVIVLFLGFLLPMWSLSFATEALGGDRENNSLIWLLSRPLPRPAVYLAKFVALLPWSLGLNVGGFAVLCLLAGDAGRLALRLYWPAVVAATVAFAALFYLVGAAFRRPAVVALVYVFFLEIILNLMPGYVKRVSISFYARCMMFESARDYGIGPENPYAFLPVSGPTALAVLAAVTVALLGVGVVVFSRKQYQDVA